MEGFFLTILSLELKERHWSTVGNETGVRTCAAYLCSLAPFSPMHHWHLTIDGCWVCQTVWFCDISQLSSGTMITSTITCLSRGARSTQGNIFQIVCNFPIQVAWSTCRLYAVILQLGHAMNTTWHLLLERLALSWGRSGSMVHQEGWTGTAAWTCGRSFCSEPHSKLEAICIRGLK